jgi:antitoxin YefM
VPGIAPPPIQPLHVCLAHLVPIRRLHPHTEQPTNLMYRLLDNAVQVDSFSEARESFKAVLDRVEADADVTLITRRHAKGAVVMSLDTYNSLMETVHLLRSPANAAHLQRSLEQAGRGELLSHGLVDPDLTNAGN